MKRIVSLLLVLVCVFPIISGLAIGASAAGKGTSTYKVLSSAATPYSINRSLRGQSVSQKAITVRAREKVIITPDLSRHKAPRDLAKHVRFAVWVYDCNTGKRVAKIDSLKEGQSYQLPYNFWRNKTYSVQVRPYMAESAWRVADRGLINAYMKSTFFAFTYYTK